VVVSPDGELFRFVSRDFADRLAEDQVMETIAGLGLLPVDQDPPLPGTPAPGPNAMPVRAMAPYYRGAKFAATAMGMRFPEAKEEAKRYAAQMDRYMEAAKTLKE
ncbi:MAG: hypothetical protein ACRDVM_06640, partial [Acidimicrobiia bacterium]